MKNETISIYFSILSAVLRFYDLWPLDGRWVCNLSTVDEHKHDIMKGKISSKKENLTNCYENTAGRFLTSCNYAFCLDPMLDYRRMSDYHVIKGRKKVHEWRFSALFRQLLDFSCLLGIYSSFRSQKRSRPYHRIKGKKKETIPGF
jgi:hypothetical protein